MAKKKYNHDWLRIPTGAPDLDEGKADRAKGNKAILESDEFKNRCDAAGVTPTKRQASKFRRKKGSAFKFGKAG